MKAYSAMSNIDFIQELREAAIRANASPLIILAIDKLDFDDGSAERIEELEDEVKDLEKTIEELQRELDAKD